MVETSYANSFLFGIIQANASLGRLEHRWECVSHIESSDQQVTTNCYRSTCGSPASPGWTKWVNRRA